MKKKYLLVLVILSFLIFSNSIFGQLINGDFEDWEGGIPTGWFGPNIPNVVVSLTQSNDAHNGSSSAKLEIVSFSDLPFPSWLQTFNEDQTLIGHPISGNLGSFSFYMKSELKSTAIFLVNSVVWDEDLNAIGSGIVTINTSSPNWAKVTVPIMYDLTGSASHLFVQFALLDSSENENNLETVGSYALIDNIIIGAVTDVGENTNSPTEFSLDQNYPNPFNPSTTIRYSIAASGNDSQESVKLIVFDVLGREIKTLVNTNQPPGNYQIMFNASDFPSGVYYYRLTTNSFVQTKKMMLIK